MEFHISLSFYYIYLFMWAWCVKESKTERERESKRESIGAPIVVQSAHVEVRWQLSGFGLLLWVPRIKLSFSGLVAGSFFHQAILGALHSHFDLEMSAVYASREEGSREIISHPSSGCL